MAGPIRIGREITLAVACVLAITAFASVSSSFGTATNAATILRNGYELSLVALGMTLLMAMGAIDVSVGAVLGVAAILVGQSLVAGLPLAVTFLVGPLAGAAMGLIAGAVVVWGRIPAIVATLGLFGVFRTVIFLLLGGQWLSGLPDQITRLLDWSGLSVPLGLLIIVAVYALTWMILRRTPYGLHLLAIGQSEDRARLMGIAVAQTRLLTFAASGALCGLAGVFYVGIYRNVAMTIGANIALEAVAAVILGGTAIFGGRCSLVGTLLGVLLLRILQNGLLLAGVPSLWQNVVTGALILGVLTAEVFSGRLHTRVVERRPAA
jgi:ribose/xylose/arabinose/galactoside ABC-type transport system permease subunit